MAGVLQRATVPMPPARNRSSGCALRARCLGRFLNVWDRLVRCCVPKRLRFDEDVGDDEHTERGRALLRQEQAPPPAPGEG